MTVKEHDFWFAALSVAMHVTVLTPNPKLLPLTGVHDVELMPLPSVACNGEYVAIANELESAGFRFKLDGHVTEGGVVSETTTPNVAQLFMFPALSVALQCTLVLPKLKLDPDAGTHAATATPELSMAVKFHDPMAVALTPFVGTSDRGLVTLYNGHVSVGTLISIFVTVYEQLVALLPLLVAVQPIYVVSSDVVRGLLTLHKRLLMPELAKADGDDSATTMDALTPLVGLYTTFGGHEMTGAAPSTTVSGNEHEFTLPALSAAVHVTVVVVSTVKLDPDEGLQASDAMPDPSAAVTFDENTTAGDATRSVNWVVYVNEDGHVIVGLTVSTTLSVKRHELEFPALSKAMHVTIVSPSGNVYGVAGEHDKFLIPLPSVADTGGVYDVIVTMAVAPLVGVLEALLGQVIVGVVESYTVTLNVQKLLIPAIFVVVQVTVVFPSGNIDPEAYEHAVDAMAY